MKIIDDDGNLSIRIHDRVEISDVELQNGEFMADAAICSECTDLPEEEEKAIYKETKDSLVQFVNGFSVGRLGTGFHTALEYDDGDCVCDFRVSESVSRRKNMRAWRLIQSERVGLMQKAVYEFIEMAHVSNEAEGVHRRRPMSVYTVNQH